MSTTMRRDWPSRATAWTPTTLQKAKQAQGSIGERTVRRAASGSVVDVVVSDGDPCQHGGAVRAPLDDEQSSAVRVRETPR